jgi:hypothetical protein
MSISTLLVILALIAFAVAAVGWKYKKLDLIAIGLALWSLAELIGRLSHLTIASIILLLAFVAFVAAAASWRFRRLNMIALGLALWMLSLVISNVMG